MRITIETEDDVESITIEFKHRNKPEIREMVVGNKADPIRNSAAVPVDNTRRPVPVSREDHLMKGAINDPALSISESPKGKSLDIPDVEPIIEVDVPGMSIEEM